MFTTINKNAVRWNDCEEKVKTRRWAFENGFVGGNDVPAIFLPSWEALDLRYGKMIKKLPTSKLLFLVERDRETQEAMRRSCFGLGLSNFRIFNGFDQLRAGKFDSSYFDLCNMPEEFFMNFLGASKFVPGAVVSFCFLTNPRGREDTIEAPRCLSRQNGQERLPGSDSARAKLNEELDNLARRGSAATANTIARLIGRTLETHPAEFKLIPYENGGSKHFHLYGAGYPMVFFRLSWGEKNLPQPVWKAEPQRPEIPVPVRQDIKKERKELRAKCAFEAWKAFPYNNRTRAQRYGLFCKLMQESGAKYIPSENTFYAEVRAIKRQIPMDNLYEIFDEACGSVTPNAECTSYGVKTMSELVKEFGRITLMPERVVKINLHHWKRRVTHYCQASDKPTGRIMGRLRQLLTQSGVSTELIKGWTPETPE